MVSFDRMPKPGIQNSTSNQLAYVRRVCRDASAVALRGHCLSVRGVGRAPVQAMSIYALHFTTSIV